MTLNEIFRRTGEPTYHTPIAVIGELVNQSGGQVTIINPPFEQAPRQKRWWKRSSKFLKGRFYITFSNCRVKKRPTSGYSIDGHSRLANNMRDIKGKMYEKNGHRCPHCGQEFELDVMELHHILPWARFPEWRASSKNMILLCHRCHKEVHCNPWRNIELMKAKAEELGIDLKERYDYGTDVCREEDHRESVGDSGEE